MNHFTGYWICGNSSQIIPSENVCDGCRGNDNDCVDGSDESNCPSMVCPCEEWTCKDNEECMQDSWVCDGYNDCDDRSDEDEELCRSLCVESEIFVDGTYI